MTVIDRTEYPNIHWRWRVFVKNSFLGYIFVTCDELAQIAGVFTCVVDLDHASLELL